MSSLTLYKTNNVGDFIHFIPSGLLPQFEEYAVGIGIILEKMGPDVMIVQNEADGSILLFENLYQDSGHLIVFSPNHEDSTSLCIDLLRRSDLAEKVATRLRSMIARESVIIPVLSSLKETYDAADRICRYIKVIRKLNPEA